MHRHTLPIAIGAGLVAAATVVPLMHHATGTAHAAPKPPRHAEALPGDDGSGRLVVPSPGIPTSAPARPSVRALVALGDSVTEGEAQEGSPFPQIVARQLSSPGSPVHAANLGVSGMTAAQLKARVMGDAGTRAALGSADVVLVTIGANDLAATFTETSDHDCDGDCVANAAAAVRADVTDLLDEIHTVLRRPGARVLVTTYWNVGVDGAVAHQQESASYYSWTEQVTRAVNEALTRAAAATGSEVVDLYPVFKGEDGRRDPTPLLADDGDHPDEAGHRAIADAVIGTLAR